MPVVRVRLVWCLSLVLVVASGCDRGILGQSQRVDEDLFSAEVTFCGINVEPLWNPDKTLVLAEPGEVGVAMYDITNLDDEDQSWTVDIFWTIDGGPEELFWSNDEYVRAGETNSGRGSVSLDAAWDEDTKFSCRLEVWTSP